MRNSPPPPPHKKDPTITWPCKVTLQIKYVITLLPQDLWLLKLAK